MKRTIYIIAVILIAASGCTKVEKTPTSGTATIDNTRYISTTYYSVGFSFSEAKTVKTLKDPGPDITAYVITDNLPYRLTFQAENLLPSFFKYGEFADEEAAKLVFDNLKTFSATQWTDMADPIAANQVWIYRSGSERYTKIRIVSTVNEMRQNIAFGECTFQWVHQPDGTATFPPE